MISFRRLISAIDFPLAAAVLALLSLGLLSIYSAGINSEGLQVSNEYIKQLVWALSGLALLVAAALVGPQRLKSISIILYLLGLLAMLYVLAFGNTVNGARSWVGLFGEFGIQPSEFMKIAAIIQVARYLSDSEQVNPQKRMAVSGLFFAIPIIITIAQSDLGSSLVFFPILLLMLYTAQVPRRFILFLLLLMGMTIIFTILPLWEKFIASKPTTFLHIFYSKPQVFIALATILLIAILSMIGWHFFRKMYYYWLTFASLVGSASLGLSILVHSALKEYQILRLIVFLNPDLDPRGAGWNILQSITAIGSGGIAGKGFLQGTQSHYRYLPQQSTDFIFSIFAEEWGFIGGIILFALVFFIIYRCILIMRTTKDTFGIYIIAGIIGMFFFHFLVNIGMTMGIMPVTGIPLLFVSYGGSSLWASLIMAGLILGISARRYQN